MKQFLKWTFLVLLAFLATIYTLHIKKSSHTFIPKKNEIIYPIHKLTNQSFEYTQSFIGTVQAIQSVNIVPYLSGFLKSVMVASGDEVKAGQSLFLLDERIPLANLNQAKEAVSQALATRTNAFTLYERMKNTEAKAISSTDLEQAKTEFQAADAAYQKALAAQNQAQTLYDYTTISAPISGWVGNITATIGEYLSPEGKVLATLTGFSPIRLKFAVPMRLLNQKMPTEKATLQAVLSDGNSLNFKDFKIMRDNRVNSDTDTISFFIDVPNPNKLLVPNAYVEVRFVYPENGILVNKNWIHLTPNGAKAFLLKNGIITSQKVKIGAPIAHQFWIQSGLDVSDEIITVPVSAQHIGQTAKGVVQ